MAITYVTSSALNKPVGPYVPATVANGFVFVSGQAGRAPDGSLAPDVEAQTRQTLANVAAILAAAGSSLQHVVRCGVFLTDMRHFERMNGVYREVFGTTFPARTTVGVAALPQPGLLVEIDAVATLAAD